MSRGVHIMDCSAVCNFLLKKTPKQSSCSEFTSLMNLCSFDVFKTNKTKKNNATPF